MHAKRQTYACIECMHIHIKIYKVASLVHSLCTWGHLMLLLISWLLVYSKKKKKNVSDKWEEADWSYLNHQPCLNHIKGSSYSPS